MKGAQLRKLLESEEAAKLSTAKAIGMHPRTLWRYLDDEYTTPTKVHYAIRWVIHCRDTQTDPGAAMKGAELQRLIDALGITQTAAAQAIKVTPRHMRKYLANDFKIPKRVAYSMRWLVYCKNARRNPDTGLKL